VILVESDYATTAAVNEYCRAHNKKFIACDVYGVCGRVFNDFGKDFEILDKNGETLLDVNIKNISCEE
jgi:molybdopterin/thiamine biosynthesis adenylyltransferase